MADAIVEPSTETTLTETAPETEVSTETTTETTTEATTLLDNPPENNVTTPADWPDDWRERMAKAFTGKDDGDDYSKELKRLGRFKSADNVFKSLREAENKISSGEYRKDIPFPADADDETKAAWRQERGIPDDPGGYLTHESMNGLVVAEEDKPLLESFLADAHAGNQSPESVKTALDWYYKTQEQIEAQRSAMDAEFRSNAVETLREGMGKDFQRNMQDLKNWLGTGPEGFMENILGARMADGSLAGDNPDFLNFMVSQMRDINPLATVVPNAGGDPGKAVADEIADIEKKMREDYPGYMKDKNMQDRYDTLLNARAKMDAR